MEILVITPEGLLHDEVATCNELLANGISRLHVRKPEWSRDMLHRYLMQLDRRYLDKVSLHEHHDLINALQLGGKHYKSYIKVDHSYGIRSKSFHSIEEASLEKEALDYAFLSPIFDSISKDGYRSAFDLQKLSDQLANFHQFPIYGLGGIDSSNFDQIRQAGFAGAVLMGAVWQQSNIGDRLKAITSVLNA